MEEETYGRMVWKQFKRHRLGMFALFVVILFCIVGIYAPIFASSKPFVVLYDGEWYFPFFRYLFYRGFYTKRLDIFFNLLMFTFPLLLLTFRRKPLFWSVAFIQIALFTYISYTPPKDPASDPTLQQARYEAFQILRKKGEFPDWDFRLKYMNPYQKLNLLLKERNGYLVNQQLLEYLRERFKQNDLPTLWQADQNRRISKIEQARKTIESNAGDLPRTEAALKYEEQRAAWINEQLENIDWVVMPLIRPYHWEDDAGGSQGLNQYVPWSELTRINRKDLFSALLFGIRISLVVGILAVALSMLIGIPIGSYAGYYGGRFDIIVSRLLEIWESMPTFFMLLLVVAITQSKSIFLVITIVGVFGWTGFSRYIRGEFFKQRNLPYVEACRSIGFHDSYIMFRHILSNAIPPILTLLPFAIMAAITSEAGLSFLGLGEEGSCSWGVLMDEGRTAFPGESYLLWPPAILLTTLLVAIALVGDALRDAIDPKLH